jgi:hypothetical protein
MYDAEIGLNEGDSITIKLPGGSLFIWNRHERVSVSVNPNDGAETLVVFLDNETFAVEAVTSPRERIKVPVKSWQET